MDPSSVSSLRMVGIFWINLFAIEINIYYLTIGVILAAERKEHSKLFVPTRESGKLYKVDDHILTAVSGIVADANYLIDYARLHCQRHLYSHHDQVYVEELVKFLCNEKHFYT